MYIYINKYTHTHKGLGYKKREKENFTAAN
jgi:hypothetical protein